jgi:hypothetical protein
MEMIKLRHVLIFGIFFAMVAGGSQTHAQDAFPAELIGIWTEIDSAGQELARLVVTNDTIVWTNLDKQTQIVAAKEAMVSEDGKTVSFMTDVVIAEQSKKPFSRVIGRPLVTLKRDAECVTLEVGEITLNSEMRGPLNYMKHATISIKNIKGKTVQYITCPSETHRYCLGTGETTRSQKMSE